MTNSASRGLPTRGSRTEKTKNGIPSHLRSDTNDIVLDREKLWIRRAIQQLKSQLRDQELAEIIEKQRKQS